MIAKTIQPPYYAVIFTSVRPKIDEGYSEVVKQMEELAAQQPGFLGIESARNDIGISVSYWKSLEAIKIWKTNVIHLEAQLKGKRMWYKAYKTRIAKVERDYYFELNF